jgi:protein tyrosine phosphatase (PTP) superfamily phosphohydrolase (DUF442 family)
MRPLRAVELPSDIAGRLYLHSMPGRYEPLEDCWKAVTQAGCSMIVCLAPSDEIQKKSPAYAAAINSESTPVGMRNFPIPDYGPPEDIDAFAKSVTETAAALKQGTSILVHCGAGIGRTGTYAIAVLMALGLSISEARKRGSNAGSGPERREQQEALTRVASLVGLGKSAHSQPAS